MKAKMRTWINLLLGAVLGFLGFGCRENIVAMYGTPSGEITIKGKVVNEAQEPLPHMQVVRRGGWIDDIGTRYWESYSDTIYTDDEGQYFKHIDGNFPLENQRLIVNDPSGTYRSDSIDTTVSYSGGNGWYKGKAELNVDFVLKKK